MTKICVRYAFLPIVLMVSIIACKKEKKTGVTVGYDSNKPIEVLSFMPDSGGIRTKFIIEGSNFGTDKSKVKVFFVDKETERQATIVNLNNETIYCLVPKQAGGNNTIKVVIEEGLGTITKTFQYKVAQSVSNVVGVSGAGGSINGTLSEGRVQRTFGIAALNNEELITFETINNTVRYISVADNRISTIQTGFDGGQPALNKARNKMYCVGKAFPHRIYFYEKNNLWQPQILSPQIAVSPNAITSVALDDSEEWLYFRDKDARFGRIEIAQPNNVQILNPACGPAGSADYTILAYSKVDDCFFFTVQSANSVYKVSKDGKTVEDYAGFNGLGTADGLRLGEAKFNSPVGLCIDTEGNLYVVDTFTNLIRKINRQTGFVSTIAGIVGTNGGANGEPRQSSFNYPYCINADDVDNFYIGESWGCSIRKLAIE